MNFKCTHLKEEEKDTGNQCCGSGMIFRVPDLDPGKVPDPSGSGSNPWYLSIFGNCKQNHLNFNHKEESINYLPFSTSYNSPSVHKVQNSQRNYIFTSALSYLSRSGSGTIIPDPDPQHCRELFWICQGSQPEPQKLSAPAVSKYHK